MNCSHDKFLENRKTEYSQYLFASLYPPKMVQKILDQTTGLTKNEHGNFVHGEARKNRVELINRSRKDKKKPGRRVFPFVTNTNNCNIIWFQKLTIIGPIIFLLLNMFQILAQGIIIFL